MHRLARPAVRGLRSPALRHAAAPRRLASTASPADKSRSWKSSALRWGVAVGAVYYYTTSSVFADEATADKPAFGAAPSSFAASSEPTDLPTVESVLEERRKQNTPAPAQEPKSKEPKATTADAASAPAPEAAPAGSPADLEEEAGQQGAFDPETGEINWDCPCLGGMAHGPCGEEFKAAFSCFVHSTEEPKGMDCIEKFQGMQECFRQYPDIYGAELADDDEPDFGEDAPEGAPAEKTTSQEQPTEKNTVDKPAEDTPEVATKAPESDKSEEQAKPAAAKPAESEAGESKPVEGEAVQPKVAEPEIKKDEPEAVAKPEEPKGPKWEDATAANAEGAEQQK